MTKKYRLYAACGYFSSYSTVKLPSDRYWEKTVNYTVQTLVESGDLPEGTDGKQYYTAGEELFNKLLENKELVEQIQNTVLP